MADQLESSTNSAVQPVFVRTLYSNASLRQVPQDWQSGTIGDVTADQMLQHYECSADEFVERTHTGDRPPTTLRKSLYLEWFGNKNGRVVIQSARLAVERIGKRAFELTEEEWIEQAKQNNEEMGFFMHQLGEALDPEDDN